MTGDWLNYGERRYGEMYAQAVGDTGYENKTLQNAKYVAGVYELSLRSDNLCGYSTRGQIGRTGRRRRVWMKAAKAKASSTTRLVKAAAKANRALAHDMGQGDIAGQKTPRTAPSPPWAT